MKKEKREKKIFIQMAVTVDLDNEDLEDFLTYLSEELTRFVVRQDVILEDELHDKDIKLLDEEGRVISIDDVIEDKKVTAVLSGKIRAIQIVGNYCLIEFRDGNGVKAPQDTMVKLLSSFDVSHSVALLGREIFYTVNEEGILEEIKMKNLVSPTGRVHIDNPEEPGKQSLCNQADSNFWPYTNKPAMCLICLRCVGTTKKGIVKWINQERGYGYVSEDGYDETRYFITKNHSNLEVGQRVSFNIVETTSGIQAQGVVSL